MRYEDLKNAIENASCDVSDVAETVLGYVLDRFDEDNEDIDEGEVYDAIREECDNYFTYYSDAWDYLQNNSITDFDEAINDGFTGICGFAYYYLVEEINDNLCL